VCGEGDGNSEADARILLAAAGVLDVIQRGDARTVKVFRRVGSSIEGSLRDDRDNELFDGASARLGQGRVGCFLCPDDSSRSGNAR
jgi:hypothetical protein